MRNLNFGMIGNYRSTALISEKGSIDWLCLPGFDSASVFASLPDKDKGGHMAIIPQKPVKTKQKYILRTNIISAGFEGEEGKWKIEDGKWRMEDEKWRMENGELHHKQICHFQFSIFIFYSSTITIFSIISPCLISSITSRPS